MREMVATNPELIPSEAKPEEGESKGEPKPEESSEPKPSAD